MPKVRFPTLKIRWTVKRKIAVAFTAMSAITVTLGIAFVSGAEKAGQLVTQTYDETVNTTIYARAASTDFSSMRAELAQGFLSKMHSKDTAVSTIQMLDRSFQIDLSTAVETARSPEIADVVETLRRAEGEWLALALRVNAHYDDVSWRQVEEKAHIVEKGVETMVSKVAEHGFDGRENVRATVARNYTTAAGGTTAAVLISAGLALFISRAISTRLGRAARFAEEIAQGKLDGKTPDPGSDEIGDLNRAMVSMRGNIRTMMDAQVILQEQSQARVAGALDESSEGVVIVQAGGTIQLINAKALDFLGLRRTDAPNGVTVDTLLKLVSRKGDNRSALLTMSGSEPEVAEIILPDGRWIQNSRNRTAEGGLIALYTDVSALRVQRDALAAANVNLDGALTNMSQGLSVFGADNRLKLANPQFYTIIGVDPERAGPGTTHVELVDLVATTRDLGDTVHQKMLREAQVVINRRRRTIRLLSIEDQSISLTHAPMPEGGWLVTLEDATERRRAESRISFLATHDALTRLPNRTLFAERVEEAIGRAKRGRDFAIHCLDLDQFKQVNDTLGHAVGDDLLQEVTRRLLACMRETDTVARLGGDEFAILQSHPAGEDDCSAMARRMIEAVSAPYSIQGQTLVVGVSIGIACAPANGLDHGKLLKSADAALYKAKEDGRGTWRFFEDEMDIRLQTRREIENDLRHAIGNRELEVHYQPLLDVRTMEIDSFEALVRWNHPTRGMIPPSDFIPIAEETGIIGDLGRYVLRVACRQAASWPVSIRLAVNVSAVQLRDSGFADVVRAALLDTTLAAERLEIEITESAFMTNQAKATSLLLSLKDLGVGFAMDDFGTGYSSLSNLRAFPFGKLKIDRSFVSELGRSDGAEQIIRTIIMLGKTLGIKVTAEGVETRKQLKFLEEEGCDTIQGYLVGRPMTAASVPELIAQYNKADGLAA